MKYLFLVIISGAAFFFVASDKDASGQDDTLTTPQLVDSIKVIQKETIKLHAETAYNLDSVEQISTYLKRILISHDYRIYKYTNPRLKLIYKWQKGSPGHWELVRKIYY